MNKLILRITFSASKIYLSWKNKILDTDTNISHIEAKHVR